MADGAQGASSAETISPCRTMVPRRNPQGDLACCAAADTRTTGCPLGHHNIATGAGDLVHQFEAGGLELAGGNARGAVDGCL